MTALAQLAVLHSRTNEGRSRVRNAFRKSIAQENGEKVRRLYEEGLGRGNLSVVEDIVSEDFRDLRHGQRGKQGMKRIVLTLRETCKAAWSGMYPQSSVSPFGSLVI